MLATGAFLGGWLLEGAAWTAAAGGLGYAIPATRERTKQMASWVGKQVVERTIGMERAQSFWFQKQKITKTVTTVTETVQAGMKVVGDVATLGPASPERARLEDAMFRVNALTNECAEEDDVLAVLQAEPSLRETLLAGLKSVNIGHPMITDSETAEVLQEIIQELSTGPLTPDLWVKVHIFHSAVLSGESGETFERIGTRTDLTGPLWDLAVVINSREGEWNRERTDSLVTALTPLLDNVRFGPQVHDLVEEIRDSGVNLGVMERLTTLMDSMFTLAKAQGSPYLESWAGRLLPQLKSARTALLTGIGQVRKTLSLEPAAPEVKELAVALRQVATVQTQFAKMKPTARNERNRMIQLQRALLSLKNAMRDLPAGAITQDCGFLVRQAHDALDAHIEDPQFALPMPLFEEAMSHVQVSIGTPALEDVAAKTQSLLDRGRKMVAQAGAAVGAVTTLLGGNNRGNVDHPLVDLFLAVESVLPKGPTATDDVLKALNKVDDIIPEFRNVFQSKFLEEKRSLQQRGLIVALDEHNEPFIEWFERVIATDADLLMRVFMDTFEAACFHHLFPKDESNHFVSEDGRRLFRELCTEITKTARLHENDPSLGDPTFGRMNAFNRKNPAWTVYAFAKMHNRRRDITNSPAMQLFEAIHKKKPKADILRSIAQVERSNPGFYGRIKQELYLQTLQTRNPLLLRLENWGRGRLADPAVKERFEQAYVRALRELGDSQRTMPEHYRGDHSAEVMMNKLHDSDMRFPGLKKGVLLQLARREWLRWANAHICSSAEDFQTTWDKVKAEFAPTLNDVEMPWTGQSDTTTEALWDLHLLHPSLFDTFMAHRLPKSGFEDNWIEEHLTDDSFKLLRATTQALSGDMSPDALNDAGFTLDKLQDPDLTEQAYMEAGGALNHLRPHHTSEAYAYMTRRDDPQARFGTLVSPPITQSAAPAALGLLSGGASHSFNGILATLDHLGGSFVQAGVHYAIGQARSLLDTYIKPYGTIDETTGRPQKGTLNANQQEQLNAALAQSLADLLTAEATGTLPALKDALMRIAPRFTEFDMQVNGYGLPFVGQGVPLAEQGAEVQRAQQVSAQLQRTLAHRPDTDPDTANWSENLNVELPQFTLMSACKTLHKLVYDKFVGLVDPRAEMEEEWARQTTAEPGTPAYEAFMQDMITQNSAEYFRTHTDRSFASLMAQLDPTQTVDAQYERFYELLVREIDGRQNIGWRKWASRPYLWGLKRVTHRLMKVVLQNVLFKVRAGLQSWKTTGEGEDGGDRPMPILLFKYITHMFNNFNYARRVIGESGSPEGTASQVDRMLQTPDFNLGMEPEELRSELADAIGNTFLPDIDVYPALDRRLGTLVSFIGRDEITSRAPFMRGIDNIILKPLKAIFVGIFAVLPVGFAWGVKTIFIQPAFNLFLRISFRGGMHIADGVGQVEGVLGDSFWSGTQYQVAIQESLVDLLKLGLAKLQEEGGEGEALDIDEIAERQPPFVKKAIHETVLALAHSLKTDGMTQHQLRDVSSHLVEMLPGVAQDKVVDIAVEHIVKFIVVGYHVAQQDDQMEMIICKLMTNLRSAMRGETAAEAEDSRHADAMSQRSATAQADMRAVIKQIGRLSVRKAVVAILDGGDTAHQATAGYAKNLLSKTLLNEGPLKRDRQQHRVGPAREDMPGHLGEWDAQLDAIQAAPNTTAKYTAAQDLAESCVAFSREMVTLEQTLAEDDLSAASKREVQISMIPFKENLEQFHREITAIHSAVVQKSQSTSVNTPTRAIVESLRLIEQKISAIRARGFVTTDDTTAQLAEIETMQGVVTVQLETLREHAGDALFAEHYRNLTTLNGVMSTAVNKLKEAMTIKAETDMLRADLVTLRDRKIEAINDAQAGGPISGFLSFFQDRERSVREAQESALGRISTLPRIRRPALIQRVTEIVNAQDTDLVTSRTDLLRASIPSIAPTFCEEATALESRFHREMQSLGRDIDHYVARLDQADESAEYAQVPARVARAKQLIERMGTNVRGMKIPGVMGAQAIDPHSETVLAVESQLNTGITNVCSRLLDMFQDPQTMKHGVRCGELALLEGLSDPAAFERRTRMTDAQMAVYRTANPTPAA
ncbi:MAG: hypothetical protein SP1CHLAM54_09350 [Chlamydiia bacterium]|nr:hypothetical protein [Chlamydiia bacterium]MCH9615841.1 hypothetical protein [Chlamydiia bacterium]MCH9628756.1 hypothetical protein [Chlamydiia bacterium]